MKLVNRFVFSLAFLIFVNSIAGQAGSGLVSASRVATMTSAQFNQRMNAMYGSAGLAPLSSSLNLYKVTYRSRDVNGRNAILSGLVAVPSQGAPNGLIVFNHGTMISNKTVPSAYRGEAKAGETQNAILAFASGGYAVAMPDYIGQGDHKANAHPYPASVTNARAGMDLIKSARAVARRNNAEIGPQLFVTGYSEGGGVAMAQTRLLEESGDAAYRVTAAAPLAGPYDLSGTTIDFMAQRGTDQIGFVLRCYLLGYMVHSLSKNSPGVNVSDYFRKAMSVTINLAYTRNIPDDDVIKRLGVAALLMRSKNDIFNVITPKFKRAFETRDARDPVIKLLRANDAYDWSPRTRMLLVALVNDSVVTPQNTRVAMRTMRGRGVGRDTLRQSIIQDTSLNHITAMPESLLRARLFFDRGWQGVRDSEEN